MRESTKYRSYRYAIAYILLGFAVIALLVLNVCIGSVRIALPDIVGVFASWNKNQTIARILWDIRLPRAAAVLILGGALALAGYLLQAFFNNPIAGPFVLGISSGAKMVVALVMVFLMGSATGKFVRLTSVVMILSAFVGAMLSMGFVLMMSRRMKSMSMLVVSGVMIGYICSAVTELVVTFADDADIVNLHNWSRGSFSGMTWENVRVMTVVVVVTSVSVFMMSKPLGAYQLGEAYAQNMGVNLRHLRVCIVLFSSVLSACVVAFAGPVSFVGIATPHLVKKFLGTAKPLWMIPACFLGGSVFCLFCDLLARTLLAPTELSISTVTAIFGAPVVLWVMSQRRSAKAV
ncbi:MAG: iron ABC transporter permease [Lachnospiraceae bacterium]|nr:iron ABC transporter permease [Lachnospiraceae bacterium]